MSVNVNDAIRDLVTGQMTDESKGHLVHPIVKAFFALTPLALASLGYVSRLQGKDFSDNFLLAAIVTIFCCQGLDFRANKLGKTLGSFLVFIIGWALVIYNLVFGKSIGCVLNIIPLLQYFKFIRNFLSSEDILLFVLALLSLRGIRRIYITDAIWLGKFLTFERLERAYIYVIVLYYMVKQAIPRIFNTAASAAGNKAKIIRKGSGWRNSISSWMLLFLENLLYGLSVLATQAISILSERRILSVRLQGNVKKRASNENVFAILIFGLFIAFFIWVSTSKHVIVWV